MGLIDRDYMQEDRRKSAILKPTQSRPGTQGAGNRGNNQLNKLIRWVLITVCLLVGYRLLGPRIRATWPAPASPIPSTQRAPVPMLTPLGVAFPRPGSAHYFERVEQQNLVSSVRLTAEAGDAAFKHVVRLQSAGDQRPFVDLYLVPGQQVDVGLPRGDFEAVTYVGDRWYGREAMFGPDRPGKLMGTIFRSRPGASFSISLGSPVYVSR